ncbi:MAG: c-type cytochrome [bacterium]
MWFKLIYRTIIYAAIFFYIAGCEVPSEDLPIDASTLSETALKGKKIFDDKNCKKCHTLGKEVMTVIEQGKEVIVPDLTNPFIATDTSYVKTHLQFLEETDMPTIELSNDEIHLVSSFVAELHKATHGQEFLESAEATCPVCKANVSAEKTKEAGLWFTYLEETFHFECEACKKLFSEQPEVFRE